MAVSVIDALIVTLGLDASKFKQGVAQTSVDLKKTTDQANDAAKKIEASGKQAAAFFTKLRNEALAMFAVFVGYTGIKAFTADVVTADAATGRLARNLAMSVEQLSEMQAAAELAGGSSAGMAATLTHMTREFQNLKLTGQSGTIPYLRLLGVTSLQELEDLPALLDKLAGTASKMDPRRANALLSGAGIDQDTINVLIQGQEPWRKHLADAKALGVTQKADAESARLLQEAFRGTRLGAMSLGRTILTELSPALVNIMRGMNEWMKANGPWLKGEIHRRWTELKAFLVDLKPRLEGFWQDINRVVESLGGWERVSLAVVGIWAGVQAAAMVTAIGSIVGLLMTPGLLPVLTALGVAGVILSDLRGKETPEEKAKTDERMDRYFKEHPNPLFEPGGLLDPHQFAPGGRFGGPAETDDERARREAGLDASPSSLPMPGENIWQWYNRVMRNRLFGARPSSGGSGAVDSVQQGLLNTIGDIEAPAGYGTRNGGSQFTDFSQFPAGIGANGTSSASGRYQFTRDTWNEAAGALGLTDFSPASQDRAAWWLADREYRRSTGRDLHADLAAGGHSEQIAAALNGRWPSLPGGSQQLRTGPQFNAALEGNIPRYGVDRGLSRGGRPGYAAPLASNHNAETHIGQIVINTQATDAAGIARDLRGALRRYSFVPESNYGLA